MIFIILFIILIIILIINHYNNYTTIDNQKNYTIDNQKNKNNYKYKEGLSDKINYKYKFTTQQPLFKNEVRNIINNSGWNNKYSFIETDSNKYDIGIGLKSREYMEKTNSRKEYDINENRIYLSRTWIKYPSFLKRSDNPDAREIEIDENNWNYGVKQSGLSIPNYKKYVINHEIGHAIGYDHKKCYSNQNCPIMYQMTKGVPNNSIPSYNVNEKDINDIRSLLY
jgi:hypothetical protein